MEVFKDLYGEDKTKIKLDNGDIVPIDGDFAVPMKKWGYKKRQRYAQLLSLGYSKRESFHFVEFHGGVAEIKEG